MFTILLAIGLLFFNSVSTTFGYIAVWSSIGWFLSVIGIMAGTYKKGLVKTEKVYRALIAGSIRSALMIGSSAFVYYTATALTIQFIGLFQFIALIVFVLAALAPTYINLNKET